MAAERERVLVKKTAHIGRGGKEDLRSRSTILWLMMLQRSHSAAPYTLRRRSSLDQISLKNDHVRGTHTNHIQTNQSTSPTPTLLAVHLLFLPFKFIHTSVLVIVYPPNPIKVTHSAHVFGQLLRLGPNEVVDDRNNVAIGLESSHNFLKPKKLIIRQPISKITLRCNSLDAPSLCTRHQPRNGPTREASIPK